MKTNKATALALVIALIIGAVPFSAPIASADECAVDDRMLKTLKAVNKNEERMIKSGVEQPVGAVIRNIDVKKGSCLPALDAFDGLMRMRIPSLKAMAGNIIQMIKGMACNFANEFIENEINGFDLSIGDPYGIVSVGISGTTNGDGGLVTESYDVGEIAKDAAIDAITGIVRDKTGNIGSGGSFSSQVSGPKDRIPRVEDSINDGVRDAFKGL